MSSSDECLDDDVIAALAAGQSSAPEALAHLEICRGCRELVSAVCARRTNVEGTPDQVARLTPGMLVGRHRIERPLGAGGMGIVYLARDLELDRDVAVKLLRGAGDERAHARLVRESQALAQLNHPNVVTAYEVGRHGTASYLIMEHVDGGTVRNWLAAAPRSALAIANIYAQGARGLAAAHAAGLVHRDVKPDNLLVGSDGRARVSDFGLVGREPTLDVATTTQTQAGTLLGTLRYMAPEVLAGGAADPQSDQWSLCASLWESLFAAPPFAGTTRDELATAIARGLPDFPGAPETPSWLRRVLVRGLRTSPSARFSSLDELADALTPSRKSIRRTAAGLIASAAVAAGIGAAIGSRTPKPTCSAELPGVWDVAQRHALAAHLRSLGDHGVSIARQVDDAVDHYAAGWSRQRTEVCQIEHTDPTGQVPALRAACLDSRRQTLGATVEALLTVDQHSLDHALGAVGDLPALEDCAAAERLAGRQPLPSDPALRTQVISLQTQYAAAHARGSLGQWRVAIGQLTAIADRSEALGYFPLASDALETVGRAQENLSDPQAVVTMRRAVLASRAGDDDLQSANTAISLFGVAVSFDRPVAERDELRAQARAAVSRLRWSTEPNVSRTEASLTYAEGRDAMKRGDFDTAERQVREAIEIGTRSFGARSARLGPARITLAKVFTARGDHDQAALVLAQAVDIEGTGWLGVGGSLMALGGGAETAAPIDAAWQLLDVGRSDQAMAFVERVRKIDSADGRLAVTQLSIDDLESEIAISRGDLARARVLNERSFAALGQGALAVHQGGLHITRADILEASGDYRAAYAEYRKAIAQVGSDKTSVQVANLGVARCLASWGAAKPAQDIVERELAAGIEIPREEPRALALLADLQWRLGNKSGAHEAANAGLAALAKLPALTAERRALEAWLAAHPLRVADAR